MADVFISYNSENRPAVEQIARVLELHGYSVWFDHALVAGEPFASPIERELRAAGAVLVIWSAGSVTSDWVREEATLAKRLGTMIPVRLERVEVPLGFGTLQMVDLARWDGAPRSHLLDQLLLEVARLVAREPVPDVRGLMAFDEAWRRSAALEPGPRAPRPRTAPRRARGERAASAAALAARAQLVPELPGEGAPEPARAASALADPHPSVAVLPFRIGEADPKNAYFGEGVVDSIIHALAGVKDLTVLSRGSMLAYARKPADPLRIGRRFGVRYVLAGTILRTGGNLRVATELTDTESGRVLAADRYEGHAKDLFAVQDEIARRVVATIAPHVREHELRRALRKHPSSLTAYDLLLQALDLLYRMDEDSFLRARDLLEKAIALDPGYAPPHTYLAFWYVFRVGEIGSPDPDADARAAAEHAAAAIQRDGGDALAHAISGHVHAYLLHDLATARMILDRAVELGPSVAMAWAMSSATHGFAGHGAEAVAHAERAVRLAPADPFAFWHEGLLAQAHYVSGDYERAAALAREGMSHNRRIRFTLRTLMASLVGQGKKDEAARVAAEFLAMQPEFRLSVYAPRCPFASPLLERWLAHLRAAGLPE